MKQSLSPGVIFGAIIGLIAVIGAIFFLANRSPAGSEEGKSSGNGIPPEIQKQISQQMNGGGSAATAGRPAGGIMAPPNASGMGGL